MLRKLVIAAVLLAFLAGVATIAWQACGMPPLRLVLKYGYPSPMGPTGRSLTIEGVEFVEISPGYFRLGSHFRCDRGSLLDRACASAGLPWGKKEKHSSECPVHFVEFSRGYWIARTEVTQAQYSRFDPRQLGSPTTAGHPVTDIDWSAASRFCSWLAAESGHSTGLPTEAQWECACRAGTRTEYFFGDNAGLLELYANHGENPSGTVQVVGTRRANPWGLLDMSGNAQEWCMDVFDLDYSRTPVDGTALLAHGLRSRTSNCLYRMTRGGCFFTPPLFHRSAFRQPEPEDTRSRILGFRPSLSLVQ